MQKIINKEIEYIRFGKKYRKIGRNEVIKEGAMQSWCYGELHPIMGIDTIGDIPANYSDEREFYNPI
jgi:Flp pilus assembly CpaF family ATPase